MKKHPLCALGVHRKQWTLYAGWAWKCARCGKFKFVGKD